MKYCGLFIKKTLMCVLTLSVLICGLSGCGNEPLPTESKPPEKPHFENTAYDSFENGLGTFYNNYSALKAYLAEKLLWTKPEDKLGTQDERTYYDNFMLLMSVADMELSVLPEFDLLGTTADYPDRAEGELPVSAAYGYKINQSLRIKFGHEKTDGKKIEGLLDGKRNLLTFTADEKIYKDVSCKTVAEIMLDGTDKFVMRYVKNITDSEAQTSLTKTVYILMKDGTATLAYYEGGANISNYIKLDMLLDYNMNALTFGAGTVLSFDIDVSE